MLAQKPPRLAIVVERIIRGDGHGRVNLEIARHAAAQGWQVTCVGADLDPGLIDLPNVKWIKIPWPRQVGALVAHRFFDRAARRFFHQQADQFDVLLGNGNATTFPMDINACHFVHEGSNSINGQRGEKGLSARGIHHRLNAWVNAREQHKALNDAKYVVAVSPLVKKQLMAGGIESSKIHVIANAVDVDEFDLVKHPREDLALPKDKTLALFVGDLNSDRKNLSTVIKAIGDVPDLHLVVAGKMKSNRFPRMVRECGVQDRIHFLGYRDDIPQLMKSAHLFVFPSKYEPFGLVILEAMASGLAVVTAASVGASSLAKEAGSPVMDDPMDAAALAQAIRELLDDPERLDDIRLRGRRIAEGYSWTRMAERYLQLARSLCSREAEDSFRDDKGNSASMTGDVIQ